MRFKTLVVFGLALAGSFAGQNLFAQDRYREDRDIYRDRQDLRGDYRDLSRDYARVDWLRAAIERDRRQLNEDIRCGRHWAAERDRRELARHEEALRMQVRDIHRDRRDIREDHRDLRQDYRDSGRW